MSGAVLRRAVVVAAAVLLSGAGAWGDEVVFKNGDRLKGEVVEVTEGRLRIRTAMVGEVVADLANVETFTTEKPVVMRMKDGTVVRGTLQASAGGNVSTTQPVVAEGEGVAKPGTVVVTRPATGAAGEGAESKRLALREVRSMLPTATGVQWRGNVRAGAIAQRGNTETDSINAAGDITRRTVVDRWESSGQYLFGRQRNDDTGVKATTTDNWLLSTKYDYFLSQKVYVFALAKAEHDEIANLDLRLTPSAGFGYQWVETPAQKFRTELGLGYTFEAYQGRDDDGYVTARLAYAWERRLGQRARLIHNTEYLPSVEDPSTFNLNSTVGLRVDLISRTFADLRVEWKYDSDPAPGARESDFRYLLSLGWEF